jgi:hypothetical protein
VSSLHPPALAVKRRVLLETFAAGMLAGALLTLGFHAFQRAFLDDSALLAANPRARSCLVWWQDSSP